MEELTQATSSVKSSAKRIGAWAKKNPLLAALLLGGVALLAFTTMKSDKSLSQSDGAGGTTEAEDILGGGGGFGLFDSPDYPAPPLLGELLSQPIADYFLPEGKPDYYYTDPSYVIPAATVYPEGDPEDDMEDKEWYKLWSEEYEASAGLETDPDERAEKIGAARWYGIASLSDKDQLKYAYPQLYTDTKTVRPKA